jgi:hypothetical protein
VIREHANDRWWSTPALSRDGSANGWNRREAAVCRNQEKRSKETLDGFQDKTAVEAPGECAEVSRQMLGVDHTVRVAIVVNVWYEGGTRDSHIAVI